ncbi:hypothetical protein ABID16_001413 [Rhizobium aquaticum]|uniref:Uncharacterized protein n=1 Tax=Rhizobium aquaticum TaxID=1549636 RepID=A0ABV2IX86_9HYPH
MHLLLKLQRLAAAVRGNGLRAEWLDMLAEVTSADGWQREPVSPGVVQPGNHPDGVAVVPPKDKLPRLVEDRLKAIR